ncbi:hypothetical protein Pyn_15655 [Prunus yedoensis var. nudiflora]|uniref:Uncharacterized protein n=1 Tax=Prunus yedoensis var. nudiflora TaxID=2094558 RepID=A0A314XY95_PRUYE|nr:hypothetical protein Pyn_15655 [Prunus yedoensis var. nudiflora]
MKYLSGYFLKFGYLQLGFALLLPLSVPEQGIGEQPLTPWLWDLACFIDALVGIAMRNS